MSKKKNGDCEYCEDCIYICEGDFICDRYSPPVLVKSDWEPTDYYCDCQACEDHIYEDEDSEWEE